MSTAEAQDDGPMLVSGESPEEIEARHRKAAIAVMLLGDDIARELFRLLEADEIELVLTRAERLGDVSAEECLAVLEELTDDVERQVPGVAGHDSMLHDAAVSALGKDNLVAILGRESTGATEKLRSLAVADPAAFAQTIRREHPQVIATVMAIMPPEVGAQVVNSLPEALKSEVIRRVATLKAVPATVLGEIAEIVGRDLQPPDQAGPVAIDGTSAAVLLLKKVGSAEEEAIFEDLERRDAELAEDLKSRMFVFEDIMRLHKREVQLILREVESSVLGQALKSASNDLKAYILSNMSTRAAQIVMDDIEALGPMTVAQVEQAQREIIEVILRLSEDGSVNLRPDESI